MGLGGALDLQSDLHLLPDTLPTALCGPVICIGTSPEVYNNNITYGPVYEFLVLLSLSSNEGLGESPHICICKNNGTLLLVSF